MPTSLRLRKPEKPHPRDPAVWLASNRMTQTEVSLRLAIHLLKSKLAATDVTVALTAHELTRRNAPQFPVERFLIGRGFIRLTEHQRETENSWQGTYLLNGAHPDAPRLELLPERQDADLTTTIRIVSPRLAATITPDAPSSTHAVRTNRLIVQTSRGLLGETRSSAEHKWLRNAIGRIVTFEKGSANDILAVAAPRSERFRDLATRWRGTEGILRCGAMILLVDRAGTVDGLPYEYRAPSPVILVQE